jgi:uncharacterized membrane protein
MRDQRRLSCTSVFDHWQSSALGIPNSLIALPAAGADLIVWIGLAAVIAAMLVVGLAF